MFNSTELSNCTAPIIDYLKTPSFFIADDFYTLNAKMQSADEFLSLGILRPSSSMSARVIGFHG